MSDQTISIEIKKYLYDKFAQILIDKNLSVDLVIENALNNYLYLLDINERGNKIFVHFNDNTICHYKNF